MIITIIKEAAFTSSLWAGMLGAMFAFSLSMISLNIVTPSLVLQKNLR